MTRPTIPMRPIGVIRTPFEEARGTPIQGTWAPHAKGTIEIDAQYAAGLEDLDGFSHVVVVYAFHRSSGHALKVRPYLDDQERGLFATRAPRRPNPIGFTVVRLHAVDGPRLEVSGVDMLDGTPVLDLKPYIPDLEPEGELAWGWLEARTRAAEARGEPLRRVADDRFHRDPPSPRDAAAE